MTQTLKPWWGRHELAMQETAYFKIGPFELWVERRPEEWKVAWVRGADPMDVGLIQSRSQDGPPAEATLSRFGVRQTGGDFLLTPVLADRPYVVDPDTPFFLPPGEKARLYVSTPLRIRFQTPQDRVPLWEEPSVLSSDTWFGPTTGHGELCYASRTRALTSLEGQPTPPHRAVSVTWVENKAKSLLPLHKLKLPLPSFSLYASQSRLWTQTVVLVRQDDDERAELRFERRPPKEAGEAKLLAGPREAPRKQELMRVFGGLFT